MFLRVSVSQPDVVWGSSWSLLESWLYLVQNSNHAKVPTCEIILRCSEKAARWRLGLLLISPGSPPALGAVGPVLHCKLGWGKKSTNFVHQTYFIINKLYSGLQNFWLPGCEKMEREWENEGEIERKWGNGERFTLFISSFSLYFLPLYPFPDKKLSHFVAKFKIRDFCRECHKRINIRAMRK